MSGQKKPIKQFALDLHQGFDMLTRTDNDFERYSVHATLHTLGPGHYMFYVEDEGAERFRVKVEPMP